MFIIGGCELSKERGANDSIEVIDFEKRKIELLEQKLKVPARGPTAHFIKDKLFVIGGCKAPKEHLDTVQVIDFDTGESKIHESLKLLKERSCHMSVYSEKHNKIWVMGGFDGYDSLNEMEVLDLNKSEAKELPKMPTRLKNGVAILNDQDDAIYMFGGWDERETMNTVFRYDIRTGETHLDGMMPNVAEGHACVKIPGTDTVFIFGGYDGLGVSDQIMKYDMKSGSGSLIYGQKLSIPRENHTAQLIGGDKILIANGWSSGTAQSSIEIFKYDKSLGSVKKFDPNTEQAMSAEDKKFITQLRDAQVRRNRPTSVGL